MEGTSTIYPKKIGNFLMEIKVRIEESHKQIFVCLFVWGGFFWGEVGEGF